MEEFTLGQWVEFTHRLRRSYSSSSRYNTWIKAWVVDPLRPAGKPQRGIVIGQRTLSNGENHYLGDDGIQYRPKNYFKVYLISFDMRRNPVYVLPEHIVVI